MDERRLVTVQTRVISKWRLIAPSTSIQLVAVLRSSGHGGLRFFFVLGAYTGIHGSLFAASSRPACVASVVSS
eukprot:scaffold2085_cov263-Pinguiococcus_pyrenoidosus.AAC.7